LENRWRSRSLRLGVSACLHSHAVCDCQSRLEAPWHAASAECMDSIVSLDSISVDDYSTYDLFGSTLRILVNLITITDAQCKPNFPSPETLLGTTHPTHWTSSPTLRGFENRFTSRLYNHRFVSCMSDTGNRIATEICPRHSANYKQI
jgi:hypothetical protein